MTTPVNTRANSGAGKSSLYEETGHNLKWVHSRKISIKKEQSREVILLYTREIIGIRYEIQKGFIF